jgi:AraC-like DNA-binding protein
MSIRDYLYVSDNHRRFYNELPLYTGIDFYDIEGGRLPAWIKGDRLRGDVIQHTELHCHGDIELLRIIEGTASVRINRETIEAKKDDIIVVNPYDMHAIEISARQPRFSRQLIIFDPEIINDSRFPDRSGSIELLETEMLKYSNVITNDMPEYDKLVSLMNSLTSAYESHAVSTELKGYLYLIYAQLLYLNGAGETSRATHIPERNEFTEKVFAYIKSNYAEQISTEDAAEAMSYNKSYFCRLFRKYFDRSFTEYLNIYRIYMAKSILISDHNAKIAQLSGSVGFSTPGFFSQIFKKYTGVLPSSFLKNINDGEIGRVGNIN